MNKQENSKLMQTLGQKKELLGKMLTMTRQIKSQLQDDQIDAFAQALKHRQALISQIDQLSKAEQGIASEDDFDTAGLKREIRGLIQETLRLDEENTALAQKKIQQYREQIKNLNQTKKGVGNYTQALKKEDAFFVDANK